MNKCVSLLMIILVTVGKCDLLEIQDTLELPFAFGPQALQTGCLHANDNKGYSVLNTTSGMILVQFTIEPLSFQHPGDDIFARPELVSYNGAIVDSQSNILYTYGAKLLFANSSVGGIESYNVKDNQLEKISSISEFTGEIDGFDTLMLDPSTPSIYTITLDSDKTRLYELDLSQITPVVEHSRNVLTTEGHYMDGILVSSGETIDEFVLVTQGTNLNDSTNPVLETPVLAGLNPMYPWVIQSLGHFITNSTVLEIVSCGESILLLTIQCDYGDNVCTDLYLVEFNTDLIHQISVRLGDASESIDAKTTLTCAANGIAFVTYDNVIYQVHISDSSVQNLTLYSYREIIWAAVEPNSGSFFVGANPIASLASSVVIQVGTISY